MLDFVRESVTDAYDLNRYLNVLHETDHSEQRGEVHDHRGGEVPADELARLQTTTQQA